MGSTSPPQVIEHFDNGPSSVFRLLPGRDDAIEEDITSGGDRSLYYHSAEAILTIK